MRKALGFWALLLLAGIALNGCQKIEARMELKRGNSLYKDEQYPDALKAFLKGLELDPEATFAWRSVGLCNLALFRPGKKTQENIDYANRAIEAFTLYLKDFPEAPKVLEYIVNLYFAAERLDEGIDYLKQFSIDHPLDNTVHLHMVSLMTKAGRIADALEWANTHEGSSQDPQVYYLIDQSARNWLNLSIDGYDAQIDYAFDMGSRMKARVGTSGTYFTHFDQHFGANPEFSVLNTSGFNGVFPSIQAKARTYFGLDFGKFSSDLYWNWIGDYRNWGGSTFIPLTRDANGNPNGGGDTVDATNTFDLNFAYRFETIGTIEDVAVSLNIRNLTDEDPPFFNGNQGGFMGGAWGYDNYTANPVGRLITLGIRTTF